MGLYRRLSAFLMMSAFLAAVGEAGTVPADNRQMESAVSGAVSPVNGLRLSGIVAIGGEPRLAVIEAEGRGARVVRPGDRLKGGLVVLELGPAWVRLDWNGEERMLEVSSSSAGSVPEASQGESVLGGNEQASAPAMNDHGPVLVGEELKEVIAGVASDERTSTQDLAFAVGAYLGLPADSEISVTDINFGELRNARAAKKLLDEKGIVRLKLSDTDGEHQHMLYLMAEDEAQSADVPDRAPGRGTEDDR